VAISLVRWPKLEIHPLQYSILYASQKEQYGPPLLSCFFGTSLYSILDLALANSPISGAPPVSVDWFQSAPSLFSFLLRCCVLCGCGRGRLHIVPAGCHRLHAHNSNGAKAKDKQRYVSIGFFFLLRPAQHHVHIWHALASIWSFTSNTPSRPLSVKKPPLSFSLILPPLPSWRSHGQTRGGTRNQGIHLACQLTPERYRQEKGRRKLAIDVWSRHVRSTWYLVYSTVASNFGTVSPNLPDLPAHDLAVNRRSCILFLLIAAIDNAMRAY
jgi:hypothetical protein